MYTPEELSHDLVSAYESLTDCIDAHAQVEAAFLQAENTLKVKEAELFAEFDAKELGSNAQDRQAKLRRLLAGPYEDVFQREMSRIAARAALELARLMVDHVRAQLRCAELAAGTSRKE